MVDRVNAPVNQNQPDDEAQKKHEEEMVKVADDNATRISSRDSQNPDGDRDLTQQTTDEENENNARPDGIPEQFWDAEKGEVNVEALLKSQQDGQAEINRLRQGDKQGDGENTDDGNTDDGENETKQDGVVMDARTEYAEKGELSDETYAALEGVGLEREMVDQYIAGQQAIVAQFETAIYGPFGGEEGYEAAVDWAAKNLSEDEGKALDAQIQSNNPAIAAEGAKALYEKFSADANYEPDVTLQGGGNSATPGSYFKSSAEMQTAMSDPRYKSDPAFRDEVAAKIARAEKAGVNLFG